MEAPIILDQHDLVEAHLEAVRSAADSNKASLGFLPASVFAGYARKGNLWVAVNASGDYLGHLLFDRRYPRATVIQMYSEPSSRRTGVAAALLSKLKIDLSKDGYLSIRASVAADLRVANDFWQSQGFSVQSKKMGGQTTGRRILVRVHELDVPQLFSRSGLGQSSEDSLGLAHVDSAIPSLYLVDLNIIFDITKRRASHETAAALFRAAHAGDCRLAISDEMRRELHRSAVSHESDPMLCLIDSLPCVHLPKSEEALDLLRAVASIVFPEKKYPGQLSKNDMSDVRHVSTAIICRLAGFITRDQRILRAAGQLEHSYQLQILSPHEFDAADLVFGSRVELDLDDGRLQIGPYDYRHHDKVRSLLENNGVAPVEIVGSWMPRGGNDGTRTSLVATSNGEVLGYIASSRFEPRTKHAKLLALVNDSVNRARDIARLLLNKAMELDSKAPAVLFQLSMPERQSCLREAAYALGFRSGHSQGKLLTQGALLKVSFRRVVTEVNWMEFRKVLDEVADLRVDEELPSWVSHASQVGLVCPDGNRRFVRLDLLETLISPVIFALRGRSALIVPIQPKYSEDLLGHSRQMSMAPRMQLETARSRKYFADVRSVGSYTKGGLVLFYESGSAGERAIVAIGRILDVYTSGRDDVGEELLSGSVLTKESLMDIGRSQRKACCVFDNVVHFYNPVRLPVLRAVGIDSSRLITALKISDDQLAAILREGFCGEC